MNNEDQIIAKAFMLLKQAIKEGKWIVACEAYELVSGEHLEPPNEKTKTRLESIRDMMNTSDDVEVEKEPSIIDTSSMSANDLKKELSKRGFKAYDFKGKKKEDLIQLLLKPSALEPDIKDVQEQSIRGGRDFGRGEIKIISDEYDPIEAEANRKLASKRIKNLAPRKASMPEDTSKDPNAAFRFYQNPPRLRSS